MTRRDWLAVIALMLVFQLAHDCTAAALASASRPAAQATSAGVIVSPPSPTPAPRAEAPNASSVPLVDAEIGPWAVAATRHPLPLGASSIRPVPSVRITPSPSATGKRPAPTTKPRTSTTLRGTLRTVSGIASTYGPGWDGWLALPGGPGIRVRICGAGGCVLRTSTDAGPDKAMQRAGRVADLDVATFQAACGVPWTRGLCRVRVEYLR